MNNNKVMQLIMDELRRAEKLHPYWPEHIVEQGAIIAEESGEVVKAINDFYWHKAATKAEIAKEVIQTAAMCIKIGRAHV